MSTSVASWGCWNGGTFDPPRDGEGDRREAVVEGSLGWAVPFLERLPLPGSPSTKPLRALVPLPVPGRIELRPHAVGEFGFVVAQRLEHRVDDVRGVEACLVILLVGLVLILEHVR